MLHEAASRRERWIGLGAGLAVLVTAAAVLQIMFDAGQRGRHALEQLKVDQIGQLARGMDSRATTAIDAIRPVVALPYSLVTGDPGDAARLNQLQATNPEATTGMMIVDPSGTITSGTLLRSGALGSKLDRPGVDAALTSGRPAVLPVAPGWTTSVPTVAYFIPLTTETGQTRGGFVLEGDIGPDSALNAEVAEFRQGRTGQFSFVDRAGTVVASSQGASIGKPFADLTVLRREPGFHRIDDQVAVVDEVPSAGWQAVFIQEASEFDGGLGHSIDNAVLIVIIGGLAFSALGFVALIRRLRRAREEQRRLEDINRTTEEFINIVSHELRTPVVGVVGFLQTTLDHWPAMSDDERRGATERALANAQRLHLFTQDILDTSRLDAGRLVGEFEVFDLRSELEAAVITVREQDGERLIALWTPEEPLWVQGDPSRLRQVFGNLLDNAVRHSPGLAPVTVRAEVEDAGVCVRISDQGPGLLPGENERIFGRFVRGRGDAVAGTGLGLHICRRIVEAHQGSIWAESPEGRGATFGLRLPLVAAPSTPLKR